MVGMHRIKQPKNTKIIDNFMVYFSPFTGNNNRYAVGNIDGNAIIGPQFNNKSMVEFTVPSDG